jgi:hypothetical protein
VPASALIGSSFFGLVNVDPSVAVSFFDQKSECRIGIRNEPVETGERTNMRIGHLKSNRSAHIMCEQRKRFGRACRPRSIPTRSTPNI